jgi:SAM-dependent methyltransferase
MVTFVGLLGLVGITFADTGRYAGFCYRVPVIELHRKLLGDKVRNGAFAKALKKDIRPGKSVVADIGAGTGFLSFLARKLGAKECHLYEYSDVLELADAVAEHNGIDGLVFIKGHSTDVADPPKADVVVCETLGNYALEENIVETMDDARRFLKPGGVMIPRSVDQFACPVVTPRLQKAVDVLDVGYGLDMGPAREVTLNNMYVQVIKPADLLKGGAKRWDAVDFSQANDSVRGAEIAWKAAKAMTVYGFALWWDALLAPGVRLSTAPDKPATHWQQIYLPLLSPVKCAKGDVLQLRIESDTRYEIRVNLSWSARRTDAKGTVRDEQFLDMRNGHID